MSEGRPTIALEDLRGAFMSTEQAEKDLLPLLLFKGHWSLGRAQAMWNFAHLAKDQGVEYMADVVRFAQAEDDAVHACGFHKPPSADAVSSLTNRIHSQPVLQRLDPDLYDYLRMVASNSRRWVLTYQVLPRYNQWSKQAWRRLPREPKDCVSCGDTFVPYGPQRYCSPNCRPSTVRPLGRLAGVEIGAVWPFIASAEPAPAEGLDVLLAVDQIVSPDLPEHLRQDVCQDVVLGLLEGEISLDDLQNRRGEYLSAVIRRHRTKYGLLSIDAPPPWDRNGRTLAETLAAS